MEKDEQEWPVGTGGQKFRASLVSQWVKILLQCRGHRRCALDIFCPMDRRAWRATAHGLTKSQTDWVTKHEGNSNPTQSASHPEDRELISECGSVYHFPHRESLSVNSVSWTALGHHWFTFWCKLLISSWSWFCRMGSRSLTQTLALKMLHEHPGPAPAHWLLCAVGCPACDVWWVLALFFSFCSLLTHCHWQLPGSCDNQKCVQGWPVSWKLGQRWGREQGFWLWVTGLEKFWISTRSL